ncbi:hypothetical protein MKY84_09750 [Chryseomicrobium sp. FSL W7-1435]|uniref:hypothetical protein n=1 Tax=Chryseomicrobium sp. FSL W7-1435 TaxID=2921704 RepID=UPI003159CDAF
MRIVIIGEDSRYTALAEQLQHKGIATEQYMNWNTFCQSNDENNQVDLLFLAIGMVHDQTELIIPSNVKEIWSGNKHSFVDFNSQNVTTYTADEDWLWMNADLTAESFLHWFYHHMPRRISSYFWEIAGYGRVAKTLAVKLKALGGEVRIRTRSISQQAEARQQGFQAVDLLTSLKLDCLCINTIPYQWLDSKTANNAHCVIDLASLPGGIQQPVDVLYYHLLALPGKVYPLDAANDFIQLFERKGIFTEYFS